MPYASLHCMNKTGLCALVIELHPEIMCLGLADFKLL